MDIGTTGDISVYTAASAYDPPCPNPENSHQVIVTAQLNLNSSWGDYIMTWTTPPRNLVNWVLLIA